MRITIPKNRESSGTNVLYIVGAVVVVGLTLPFQPRRLRMAPAATGCKVLGG